MISEFEYADYYVIGIEGCKKYFIPKNDGTNTNSDKIKDFVIDSLIDSLNNQEIINKIFVAHDVQKRPATKDHINKHKFESSLLESIKENKSD